MIRSLLFLALVGCTSTTDGKKDRPPKDDDTAADTDSGDPDSGDTDTGRDTDDSGAPDLDTYEGFVEAHAGAYCASLDTCDYLDDQGHADRRACMESVIDFFRAAPCESYQRDAADLCIREDLRMARACEEFPGGLEPRACQDVCTPPA